MASIAEARLGPLNSPRDKEIALRALELKINELLRELVGVKSDLLSTVDTEQLVISNTALITNLNADLIDGLHADELALADHTHDEFALASHGHSEYALAGHTHPADDDDHSDYVHRLLARTIVAQHTFAPSVAQAPFLLSANARGQFIAGLNAEFLSGQEASDFEPAFVVLEVGKGGTGLGSIPASSVLVANVADTLIARTYVGGSGNRYLKADNTGTIGWADLSLDFVPVTRQILTPSGGGLIGGSDLSTNVSLTVLWSDGYSVLDGRYAQLTGAAFTGDISTTGDINTTGGHVHVNRAGDAADASLFLSSDDNKETRIWLRSGSSLRWLIRKGATAASLIFSAYDDTGAFIDSPFVIGRAAAGIITLARPVSLSTGDLRTAGTTRLTNAGALQNIISIEATGNINTATNIQTSGVSRIDSVGNWLGAVIGVIKGGTGLANIPAGSILAANVVDTFIARTWNSAGDRYLKNASGTIGWVDLTTDFVPITRQILTPLGGGILGGGDLSANRSLTVLWSDGYSTLDGRYEQLGHTHALDDLSDVTITTVGSGEVLGYTTGWINRTLAEAGIAASSVTITAGTGLTGGGDLTASRTINLSTPVSVAHGGTGLASWNAGSVVAVNTADVLVGVTFAATGERYLKNTNGTIGWVDITSEGFVPTSRQILTTSGGGLTGGGDLSADRTLTVLWSDGYSDLDGRYYTETEVNSLLAGKSDTGHQHALTSSSITGILPVSKGGTGSSLGSLALRTVLVGVDSSTVTTVAAPTTSGQVLRWNGGASLVWDTISGTLPAVDATDNGKMLQVSSGAWAESLLFWPTVYGASGTFLAGAGSSMGWRALIASDIPSLDMSKITSGNLVASRVSAGTFSGAFAFSSTLDVSANLSSLAGELRSYYDNASLPALRGGFDHAGNSLGILSKGGLQIYAQGANNANVGSGSIQFFTTSVPSVNSSTDAAYINAGEFYHTGMLYLRQGLNVAGGAVSEANNSGLVRVYGSRIQIFPSASGAPWQIDNNTGTLRFFLPGVVHASLSATVFTVGGSVVVGNNLSIPSLKRFFLDGGNDSYIEESSPNTIRVVVNNIAVAEFRTDGLHVTKAYADL